jgi:hypothetical protein
VADPGIEGHQSAGGFVARALDALQALLAALADRDQLSLDLCYAQAGGGRLGHPCRLALGDAIGPDLARTRRFVVCIFHCPGVHAKQARTSVMSSPVCCLVSAAVTLSVSSPTYATIEPVLSWTAPTYRTWTPSCSLASGFDRSWDRARRQ